MTPAIEPATTAAIKDVWLEIGFGAGEHLLWQARAHPDVGIIGCEPFEDGVLKVLAALDSQGLANVRLHPDDARPVLGWLPPGSVGRIFILFPDPWPKARHKKRRLLSHETLLELVRVLRSGGDLRFATDVGDYAEAVLEAAAGARGLAWDGASPELGARPADWPPTRYEGKALAAGRPCRYLRFKRP